MVENNRIDQIYLTLKIELFTSYKSDCQSDTRKSIHMKNLFLVTLVSLFFYSLSAQEVILKIDTSYAITKIEDNYPCWSPDGQYIAFHSNRHGGSPDIYIMTRDGKNIRRLTNQKYTAEVPIFSPDGKYILFAGYQDDKYINNDLYLMNADGSNLRRIIDHPLRDGHAQFSPDGKKIIFNSQRDDEGVMKYKNYELYEMEISTGTTKRITNYADWDTYPSYSPDGTKILWRRILTDSTNPRGYNSEVFSMNIDGTNVQNLSNHEAFDGYPEWSPDGQYIVFVSTRGGEDIYQERLFVMTADGKNVQQITHNKVGEEDNRPSWSKDGKYIAFNRVKPDGSRIYIAKITLAK